MDTLNGSETAAVVAALDPQSVAAGASASTGWVPAKNFAAFLAVIAAGAIAAGGSLDVKVQQAKAADGTGTKDVPNAAITTLTNAGGGSGKQAIINTRSDLLDINNGFAFVRVTATATGGAALVSAVILGLAARELPASDMDAASVVEIVG
jgi:hypothetical protein